MLLTWYVTLPSSVKALGENYHLNQLWPTAVLHCSLTWWSGSTSQTWPQSLQCTTDPGEVLVYLEEATGSLVVPDSSIKQVSSNLTRAQGLFEERPPASNLVYMVFPSTLTKNNWVSRCCLVNGCVWKTSYTRIGMCRCGISCEPSVLFHYLNSVNWQTSASSALCQNIPLMFPL